MDKRFKDWYNGLPGEKNDALMVFAHNAYLLGKGSKALKSERIEGYADFVDRWVKAYPDLGFSAVDGKKMKSIISKIKGHAFAGGKGTTPDVIVPMWEYLLAYLKREHHWYHGKSLSIIEPNVLSIIFEIRNGKQKSASIAQSTRQRINDL